MKYYIIAGEASGDLHASNLINHLFKLDTKANVRCWGGDLMQQQGAQLVKHYRELAFMGIIPVLLNLRAIAKNLKFCKTDLLQFKPDVVIFVDYPGFNLRMARFAKQNRIKTIYYISPKIWAWKTKRVLKIKRSIDLMLTIFPFETQFYKKWNYSVTYVGNPLFDAIEANKGQLNENFRQENKLDERPIIALLAGSRKHEIEKLLPTMIQATNTFPNYQFVIAGAPNIDTGIYNQIIQNKDIKIVYNQTYTLLQHAQMALVTSGTATLETALFNVPQVVCYKMGFGNVLEKFRNQILKVPFFSLVNLIAGREVVKELFQSQVTPENIAKELTRISLDEAYRNEILKGYAQIRQQLQTTESASLTAARNVMAFAKF
jgi:lipid-A-disaccharide synthase